MLVYVSKKLAFVCKLGLNRAFTAGFELYNTKVLNPENAKVDIFIALK